MKKGGLFPLISPKSVPDGLVCWLVGEGIKFLKEGGLFPLISHKWFPDGLVGWLVGDGIEFLRKEGSYLSSPLNESLIG